MTLRLPYVAKVSNLADAQALIRASVAAGHRAVYLTPAMYKEIHKASAPGGDPWGASIAVYAEALMPAGMALVAP